MLSHHFRACRTVTRAPKVSWLKPGCGDFGALQWLGLCKNILIFVIICLYRGFLTSSDGLLWNSPNCSHNSVSMYLNVICGELKLYDFGTVFWYHIVHPLQVMLDFCTAEHWIYLYITSTCLTLMPVGLFSVKFRTGQIWQLPSASTRKGFHIGCFLLKFLLNKCINVNIKMIIVVETDNQKRSTVSKCHTVFMNINYEDIYRNKSLCALLYIWSSIKRLSRGLPPHMSNSGTGFVCANEIDITMKLIAFIYLHLQINKCIMSSCINAYQCTICTLFNCFYDLWQLFPIRSCLQ